jgi:hypothetical protein
MRRFGLTVSALLVLASIQQLCVGGNERRYVFD